MNKIYNKLLHPIVTKSIHSFQNTKTPISPALKTIQSPGKSQSAVWKWSKRIGMGLSCLTASLIVTGIAYQYISTKIDERKYPAPGKLIDVGGYRLHIHCTGANGPTVVFDSGLGNNSLEWSLIQPEIAKSNRVCSYDRAGNGWSDKSPQERTSKNIVGELHSLLKNAGIPGPYVLVGHSFGGPNVLLYASMYPEEVAAIVLVDSAHEDQLEKMPFIPKPNSGFLKYVGYVGGFRLLSHLPQYKKTVEEGLKPLPPEIREMTLAKLITNQCIESVSQEGSLLDISLKQVKEAKCDLKDKPLIVITAGKNRAPQELGLSPDHADQFLNIWETLQKDLVTRSTKGMQMIAKDSGHMIPLEQHTIVVEAIQKVLADLENTPKTTCI